MRCISPILVRQNGRMNHVPCGKCNFCLQQKRFDWSFRLGQELKLANTAKFLTLTYDDEKLHYSPSGLSELSRRDLTLFTKRLRKDNAMVCDWPLRYYSVGEYGTLTVRPHYHSIMFNMHPVVERKLLDIWSLGHVHVGEVSPASIHYVTKYVVNRVSDYGDRAPPVCFMSKHPGIGSNYLKTHKAWHRADARNFTQVNGKIGRLPRYYKDKIFNAVERQVLSSQSVAEADVAYWEDVEKLSLHSPDPFMYYDDCVRFEHDHVRSKINPLNKF